MSWILSECRAAVFLSYIEPGSSDKSHVLSQLKKSKPQISLISPFLTLRTDFARLRGHRKVESEDVPDSIHDRDTTARRFDTILTHSAISQSRAISSQTGTERLTPVILTALMLRPSVMFTFFDIEIEISIEASYSKN